MPILALPGSDLSGNNNVWATNNIGTAETSGITYDVLLDSPTNTVDSSGNVIGNYCTLDTGTRGSYVTISNGGLTITGNTATNSGVAFATTDVTSGKWYWENTITLVGGLSYIGVGRIGTTQTDFNNAETFGDSAPYASYHVRTNGQTFGDPAAKVVSNVGTTFATGDVLGAALDMDSGALYLSKNGTWLNSGNPVSGLSKTGAIFAWSSFQTMTPLGGGYNGSINDFNFGQRAFAYTPPTGFKSLNTKNLDEQSPFVTGPDLVWIKRRNALSTHTITDTVRGANREIFSNLTDAEQANTGQFLQQFSSNGFTLGANASGTGDVNISGGTYVGWNWNAGSRTVGNQIGSIPSQVRANPAAGFSIVTYRGTGVSGTVGHGLGIAPKMMIIRGLSGASAWLVYHASTGAGGVTQLQNTGVYTSFPAMFNSTPPSSTIITIGTDPTLNGSGGSQLAYCFAEIPGYSKISSYTGNGSTDGPFVYCGFSPKYIMWKRTDAVSDWVIQDTSRAPANPRDTTLYPNLNAAEGVGGGYPIDILSNGFKLRNSAAYANASGGNYAYIAFAEMPSKYALAR